MPLQATARRLLLKWVPFGVQKRLLALLVAVLQRVVRKPVIGFHGHRVYLAPDDPSTAGILAKYLIWRTWSHEHREQEILEKLIRARGQRVFFIDGGASFGMYTFLAASQAAVAQVIAVEASPQTFALLDRSVRESTVAARVRCMHGALVDRSDRRLAMSTLAEPSEWHKVTDSGSAASEIPALTIDGLVDGLALQAGDSLFIKLDIEGSEVDAVAGMQATLAAERDTVLMIEFHAGLLDRKAHGARDFARTLYATNMQAIYAVDTVEARLYRIASLEEFLALADRLSAATFPDNLRNLFLVKRGLGSSEVAVD